MMEYLTNCMGSALLSFLFFGFPKKIHTKPGLGLTNLLAFWILIGMYHFVDAASSRSSGGFNKKFKNQDHPQHSTDLKGGKH